VDLSADGLVTAGIWSEGNTLSAGFQAEAAGRTGAQRVVQ